MMHPMGDPTSRAARWLALLVFFVLPSAPARADDGAYSSTVHARQRRDASTPQIVLTARDLQQRGAQNLKDALELIPEIQVRQGGMGTRFDIRGARQRSVLLLIDGVALDEPWNGAFEITSIPVTDIVEIRVQLTPASPLEGPGGDGGIIEVFTLRAVGSRRLDARVVGGTTPYAEGAVTGRTPLNESGTLAMRASAGAHFGDAPYPVVAPDMMSQATFFDRDAQVYTALRLESQTNTGRFTGDVWYGHRAYFIPPSDNTGTQLQDITGQDAVRAVFGGELYRRGFRLALGAYGELLAQATDFYNDYTLSSKSAHQDLLSGRMGAAAVLDHPFAGRGVKGLWALRLSVDGEGASINQTGTMPGWGLSTYGSLALGAKLKWRWLSVDGAAGLLLPFTNPSAVWPEGKLTVGFEPVRAITVLLIGARKGRLPTLRELYDPIQGNSLLHPEQTWHGEVQVQMRPHPLVFARMSGYLRQIDGFIRLNPATGGGMGNMMARNVNLDTIEVRGGEGMIEVARDRFLGGGIAYIFEDANSPTLGFQPIANFPAHRVDTFLSTTFWHRRLGGLLRFRWVAERDIQGVTLPRYYVMELYTWARVTDQIRASLKIDNLTNNKYLLLPGLNALGTTGTLTVEGVWE
jgi:outer membrane cobalamin receptor